MKLLYMAVTGAVFGMGAFLVSAISTTRTQPPASRLTALESRTYVIEKNQVELADRTDKLGLAIGYKDYHDAVMPHDTIEKSLQEIEADIRRIDAVS